MKSTSLQSVLLLPFVLLIILLAATIGGLSYHSSENSADTFSQRVVLDIIARINQSTESHLAGSYLALKAVIPDSLDASDVVTEAVLANDFQRLEERFWIATGFYPDHRSIYFGREDGAFIGLSRLPGRTELRVQLPGRPIRDVYAMQAPFKKGALLKTHSFNARDQLWYTRAADRKDATWSPVYTDMNTMLPTLTLSKPVYRSDGTLAGVVATDLPLQELTEFFKKINVSPNGVAFIVDRQGAVVASSSQETTEDGASLPHTVRKANRSALLLHQAYGDIRGLIDSRTDLSVPVVRPMESDEGRVHLAIATLKNAPGLDWTVVVAVPRDDFMSEATRSLFQNFIIGCIAVLIALIAGVMILRRVLRDIRKLTDAARKIERGEPVPVLDISRRDELGQLAQSFMEMETGLRTDRLTGVLNRESLIIEINLRQRHASPEIPLFFSLLFIDLDRFKAINDFYGHEAGDRVLIETAKRMKKVLRSEDRVARFGGDEFVIYLDGVSASAYIQTIIDKLLTAIGQPIVVAPGVSESIGASIGSAHYPIDGVDVESLFKTADARMFDVKKRSVHHRAA